MRPTEPQNGYVGVVAIVGATVVWDVHALTTDQQTISEWVGNFVQAHPVTGWAIMMYLLFHLTRHPRILRRIDPLRIVADSLARKAHHQ